MSQLPTTSHPLAIAFDEASGPRIGLCPLLPQAIIAAHGPFVLDRRTCVSGDRDASLDTLVCQSRTGLAIAFHFSVWTDCPFAKITIEITNDSDRCVTWQGDGLYTIAVDQLLKRYMQ